MRDSQGALRAPKVVLFDAGNTLIFLDHEALLAAAGARAADLSARTLSKAETLAKKSYEAGMTAGMDHEQGWHLYMRTMFSAVGLDAAEAEAAAREARRLHDEFNLWRKVPDDLRPALERGRARGLRFGVVSNSEGTIAQLLERVELGGYFEHVLDSAVEGVRKPDPEIFRRALARMQVNGADALYAGDIPRVDVEGARAAGMEAVLIDALDHYPDYTGALRFPSVAALLEALCL